MLEIIRIIEKFVRYTAPLSHKSLILITMPETLNTNCSLLYFIQSNFIINYIKSDNDVIILYYLNYVKLNNIYRIYFVYVI